MKVCRLIVGLALMQTTQGVMAVTNPQTAPRVEAAKHPARKRAAVAPISREMIVDAQTRLRELGYWLGEADGRWGEESRQALVAFQKVERRPRTGRLTLNELAALKTASRPTPKENGGAHIEVDLARQVLFIVDATGSVSKVLPVSSGNGKTFEIEGETEQAITPTGRFRIYRKLAGMRRSPLGLLYYPNYIVGGIAIHGNGSVPVRPASHGCIRIPMFAAKDFSELTPIGTEVIVYNGATL